MNRPDQRVLFLFPGQGSQYLGMGQDLYQAYDCVRQTYDEASEILGYDMAALSFEDPQEHIHLTRYTQPVLLTHSVACLRVLQELLATPISAEASAGHSLGEYTALVAAGALEFKTALDLVHHRGTLMGTHGNGEMEALPLELEEARLLAEKHLCSIAACNLPDQTVVGGLSDRFLRRAGSLISHGLRLVGQFAHVTSPSKELHCNNSLSTVGRAAKFPLKRVRYDLIRA